MSSALSQIPERLLSGRDRAFDIEQAITPREKPTLAPGVRQCGAYVLPPFQRAYVWDEARQRAYVEGIFLGLGTGSYVWVEPDYDDRGHLVEGSLWLLDGQQRITTLRRFVLGELAIFDNLRYGDLSVAEARRWLRTTFPSQSIEYSALSHQAGRYEQVYQRLNFCVVPH